ncbi:hypothetical protein HPB48_018454 [Haemaphysalis longicornis]|uniref:Vitellogenin domain-containing protein n=1 Tax=Haemaphysalis longicornis TaxID=44386 RepID=A0A9J6FVK8_HAELO|nr:hypothetical protein HPB48_018454 [Haemaphysalis longicornis]
MALVEPLQNFSSFPAGPVDRSKTCSRHCTESRKFSYQPGTTYLYDYASTTETSMQGTTSQKVAVHIAAQIEIEPLGSCDYSMHVRGATLEEEDPLRPGHRRPSPNQAELRAALERYSLRFSYQDGRVDNVCPSEGETPRALNVKKAILSMLQNSMKQLEVNEDVNELDIAGRCPTIYETLPKGWSSMSVRRIKDLSQCKDRESAVTALQASSIEGSLRSSPVVKGRQECKQVFQNGLIDSVECKESHIVRPFSKRENGARTDVSQKLNLRSQRRGQARRLAYNAGMETDLLFDHDYEVEDSSSSMDRAENALRAIVESAGDVVKSSSPGLFTELTMLRRSESMSAKAKQFFVDSLPAVGTPAAIRMMTDSMVRGEVSGVNADIWLTSLAFVSKPTADMIEHSLPLLKLERPQAYLGVSTMAHTFCRNNANCGSARPIKELVRALYLTLGDNCFARDAKTTLTVLKALGNLGQSEGAEETLYRCFQNPQLDIEIRLAAVEAFRRFDCDIPRNQMLAIYQNIDENVEMRIGSYLAAIRCPSSPVIEAIRNTLRTESIKQVGSFVYSHIRNLAREPSPFQREYRVIANDLALRNRFELDFRKFSRNVHYRMFFDPLDTGFELDGDVVYTPDSYYPRSARVATSFDIFGKKIDLFEAGARVEHMDKLIEKWMPSDKKDDVRAKKAIANNKIDDLDRRFAIKAKYSSEPKASAYIRLFGNEIASMQLAGGSLGSTDDLYQWYKQIVDPKGLDLTKSILFADTSLTVPAGSGLPLRVSVNGSATVALKVGGNSQFNKGSFDVTGLMKPSGAVELAMLMSVDAHKSTSGVRMVATMSSSWAVDGSVQLQRGKAIKAKLNMPQKEMELIDVKAQVPPCVTADVLIGECNACLAYHAVPQKKMEAEACTGSTMEAALGVKLCGRAEFPVSDKTYRSPMYPFSGNAEVSLRLVKTDPTLTSYDFESSWTNTKDLVGAIISVNTPGTVADREIMASLQHNLRDGTIALKLKTPPKKLSIEGQYNFDQKLKKVNLQAKSDDETIMKLLTELKADFSSNDDSMVKYTHLTELTYRDQQMALVNGQWAAVKGRKYSGSLNIEKLTEKPVLLKVDVDMTDKRRMRYEGSIRSFFVDGSMSGYTQSGDNWSTKMDGEFSLMSGRPEKMGLTAKFRDLSSGALTKYSGAASFQNTFAPALNTDLQWDCQKTDGQLENSLQIVRGEGGKKNGHTIKIQQIARYTGTLANNNAGLTLKLKYPQKRLDWQMEMKHENTPTSLANRMDLTYAPGRQIRTVIDVSATPEPKANLELSYPGREMRMMGNYRTVSSQEYRGDALVQWNTGKQVEVSGVFKPVYDRRHYNPSFEAEVRLPGKRPATVTGSLIASRGYYAVNLGSQCSQGRHEFSSSYRSSADGSTQNIDLKLNMPNRIYSAAGDLKTAWGKLAANANIKLDRYRDIMANIEMMAAKEGKTFKFDCKWDAARDASRRASIDAEVRRVPGGYNANFAIKCPKQDIRGTVATTVEGRGDAYSPLRVSSRGELEWMPRKKMTYTTSLDWNPDYRRRALKADVHITTPFSTADTLGAVLTHNDDGREWNTEAKVTLPRNRILALSTDGQLLSDRSRRVAKATLKARTPYNNEYIIEAIHGATYYDTTNKISLRWAEGKVLSAEVNGAYGRGTLNAKAEVLTPVPGYEMITASFDHAHTPESLNKNGAKGSVDGKVRITTPFRGAEEVTSQLAFSNNGRKTIADFQATRNADKFATGFAVGLKKSRYDVSREMKVYLSSPIYGYENLEATGSYSSNPEKFNVIVSARLPYEKRVSLRSENKLGPYGFESLLHIQLPIRNYERINLEVSHTANNRNAKTTGLFIIGPQKFTLDASGDYVFARDNHEIKGTMVITTPIRDYQRINIDLRHTRSGLTYETSVKGTSETSSLTLDHNLMIRDIGNFEHSLNLVTPFPALPILIIKNKNQVQRGSAYHNSEVEWSNRRKVVLTFDGSARQSRYANEMEGKMQLSTPWRSLNLANIRANYNANSQQIEPKITVEWNRNSFISMEGSLKNSGYSTVQGSVALTSSIRPIEAITLNAKYDVATEQKYGEVSLQWDPRPQNKLTLTATGSLKPTQADIDLSLTTPIRSYERIQLIGNVAAEKAGINGKLSLSSSHKKYELITDIKNTRSGSSFDIALNTPLRGLETQRMSGEYNVLSDKIISNLNVEWQRKVLKAESEISKSDTDVKAMLTVDAPFRGFRNARIILSGSARENTRALSGLVEVDKRKFEMNGFLDMSGRSVKLELRSPIANMESLEINGNIQEQRRASKANLSLRWSPNEAITLEAEKRTPGDLRSCFDHSVPTNLDLDHESKMASITLEKEGEKISLIASGKYANNKYEGDVELTTPFRSLEFAKMSGKLKSNGINDWQGAFSLQTPIRLLSNVELAAEYTSVRGSLNGLLHITAPTGKYEIKSQTSYRGIEMIDSSLSAEYGPINERKSSLALNLKTEGLRTINANFLLSESGREHSFGINMKNHGPYEGSILVNCPMLEGNKAEINYVVNIPGGYDRYMDFKITGEYARKVHILEGSFENKLSTIETQIKLNCPLLKQGPAAARLLLSSRSVSDVKAELSIGFERDMNTINVESFWGRGRANGKLNIDSSYLPSRTLKADATITTNHQGADVSITIEESRNTHQFNGNWKQLSGSADGQFRIESPFINPRTLTGNFNFVNDNRNNRIESSLILSTQRKNLKCFLAISARDLTSMEGNLKIETPFESLRFANVDARFNNIQNRAIDWSLGVKSSMPSLQDASVSGKMRQKEGSVEATLQGSLPIRALSSFESTFVCTYNRDFTSFSPRLSILVPRANYVSEAEIRLHPRDYSIAASHEWGPRQKIHASLAVTKPKGEFKVATSLITPFRSMERYEAGMACGRDGEKRVFRAFYTNPRNELFEVKHANSYHSPLNFLFENTLVTPVPRLQSAGLRILQQSSRSRLATSIECNLEEKKVSLNLDHDRRDVKGALSVTTSMPKVRAVRATYELNRYKIDGELNVNDRKVAKVAGSAEYVPALRAHKCDLALQVPSLHLAMDGHYKPVNSGKELSATFNSARRTIQLQTLWQNHPSSLVHQASLKWGQDRGDEFSYDLRMTQTRRRQLANTDVSCKVNFPLRAFEVRASKSESQNANSLSCELFWDAARDQGKHVAMTMEHQNLSTRSAWAHKVSASLKHPRLNKDITMRLEGSVSADEVHGKTELEYSPDVRHNLMVEGRLKNHGRSHLSAELTARQPISLMDIRTVADLKNGREEASATVTVNYMNRNRQMRVQELKASIFKLRQAIDLLLRSGRDSQQLKGEMYNRNHELGATLEHKVNDQPPTTARLRVNKRHSNAELIYTAPDSSSASMTASASANKHEIRLSHTTLGRSVSDILIKMGLKEKRFLSSEINWRPELTKEASEYAAMKYGNARSQLYDIWQSFSREAQQELRAKRIMMGQAIGNEISPLLEDISRDWRALNIEVSRAVETLKELYRQDQFYVRTIVSACSGVITAIGQVAADTVRLVLVATDYVIRYSSAWIEVACEKIADIAERFAQSSRRTLIFIERLLSVAINRASIALVDATEALLYRLEALLTKSADKVVEFCERYGPSTSGVRDFFNRIMESVSSYTAPMVERIQKNAFVKGLSQYIERAIATLGSLNTEAIAMRYRTAYKTVNNAVSDVYENVVYHPHVQYISEVTQNAVRKVRDVSDMLGLHDITAVVIDMGAQQIQDSIVEGFTDAVREYSNLRSGLRYDFTPEHGMISAEIRLPGQKDSIRSGA